MQALQLYEAQVCKEPVDGVFKDITTSVLVDPQESDCDTDESDIEGNAED